MMEAIIRLALLIASLPVPLAERGRLAQPPPQQEGQRPVDEDRRRDRVASRRTAEERPRHDDRRA